jgi:hypothetical protein
MELVIVESPYAEKNGVTVEEHIKYARKCVKDSLMRDEAPIASHLLYTQDGILDDKIIEERELGIMAGLEWRKVSQKSVFYIDYGFSSGMEFALQQALDENRIVETRKIL